VSSLIYDVTDKLIIDYRAREWCKLPYPGHDGKRGRPLGCPNYGKKKGCPPEAPLIENYADRGTSIFFMVTSFDLGKHMDRMKIIHPEWSDRQARCCLYWQAGVRKELESETKRVIKSGFGSIYTLCPEAMGVSVILTLLKLGIAIKVHPEKIVYKVSLICYPAKIQC
jgi:hypothetical protein